MPITAANGTVYDDSQIKQFVSQHNGDPNAIAAEAAQLGLNQGQIQQALQIGGYGGPNMDPNSLSAGISSYVNAPNSGYSFGANGALTASPTPAPTPVPVTVNPNAAGGNAQGGSNGMLNGTLTTAGGQQVTHQQLADFAATNPNDQAIMAFAQKNGMSNGDIATSLNNLGLLYNGGNPTSTQTNDPSAGSLYNRLMTGEAYGTTGYGATPSQGTSGAGVNPLGNLVTGGWHPSGTGGGGVGTPGVQGPQGAAGGATGLSTGSSGHGTMPAPSAPTGPTGFQTSSRPMAGEITGMLNQPMQYGLSTGLNSTGSVTGSPTTPAAAAQSTVGGILGNSLGNASNQTGGSSTSPSVGNVVENNARGQGLTAPQPNALGTAPGQATTQMQQLGSLLSSIPVGNPTPFGSNAQITKTPDGRVMITSPTLQKPYMVDMSLPMSQQLQQLQAVYDMANPPVAGSAGSQPATGTPNQPLYIAPTAPVPAPAGNTAVQSGTYDMGMNAAPMGGFT